MTLTEWTPEIEAALAESEWRGSYHGLTAATSTGFFDATNARTGEERHVKIGRDAFYTPELRRAEMQRQLSIAPAAGAALDPAPTYWQLRAPSGRTLTCGLHRTAAGLELRAGYAVDDPTRTAPVSSAAEGARLAGRWQEVARATGRFTSLADGQEQVAALSGSQPVECLPRSVDGPA